MHDWLCFGLSAFFGILWKDWFDILGSFAGNWIKHCAIASKQARAILEQTSLQRHDLSITQNLQIQSHVFVYLYYLFNLFTPRDPPPRNIIINSGDHISSWWLCSQLSMIIFITWHCWLIQTAPKFLRDMVLRDMFLRDMVWGFLSCTAHCTSSQDQIDRTWINKTDNKGM